MAQWTQLGHVKLSQVYLITHLWAGCPLNCQPVFSHSFHRNKKNIFRKLSVQFWMMLQGLSTKQKSNQYQPLKAFCMTWLGIKAAMFHMQSRPSTAVRLRTIKDLYGKCPKISNPLWFLLPVFFSCICFTKYSEEWQQWSDSSLQEQSTLGKHCLHMPFSQRSWSTKV